MSEVSQHISQLRDDFIKGELTEASVEKTPDLQFEKWMKEAIDAKVVELQACNLSTVSDDCKPSSRILYLRDFKNNEFSFYTNYNSRKSIQINKNPHVCFTLFWPELERQIRVEGVILKKTDSNVSDDYFNSRPTESKIGAWSSPQSSVIKNRDVLDNAIELNTEKYKDKEVPRPDFWGGFVIQANYYEFWQGRRSRLHDRIIYTFDSNIWKIERLAP
jgi:pyridoxamine 5'-phosphate oxidase